MAAQGDEKKLLDLWRALNRADILGEIEPIIGKLKLIWKAFRKPFYYYGNDKIKELIRTNVDYQKLTDSHLLITATNFVTGCLETFYISDFVTKYIEQEKKRPIEEQRFNRYRRIGSQEELELALCASCSIPFFFPPVKIGEHLYVDGGVGNNTPTQQAAVFARHINSNKQGACNLVVCNMLDSERFILADDYNLDMSGMVHRTIDIFQHTITEDKLLAWSQINRSVSKLTKFQSEIGQLVQKDAKIPQESKATIMQKVSQLTLSTSGTPRQNIDIVYIRPSQDPYVNSTLDFNSKEAESRINDGYIDTLRVFNENKILTEVELKKLANLPGYGV